MSEPFDPVTYELKEKVASLEAALLSRHPTMPTLLKQVHSTLLQYPEQVTILSPEERATIIKGLSHHTGVKFAEAATKKPSASKLLKDRIKNLGVDAF